MTKFRGSEWLQKVLHKKTLWQERLDSFYSDNKFYSDIEQFSFYTEKDDTSPAESEAESIEKFMHERFESYQ